MVGKNLKHTPLAPKREQRLNPYLEESEEEPEADPEEKSEEEPEEDPKEESEGEPEAEAKGGPAELVVDQEEEEAEGDLKEDPNKDEDGDSDAESEFINPHYPIRVPAYRVGPTGPTPPWGIELWRWSRHQGQQPPFGMSPEFYDPRDGGQTDCALLVMVRRLQNTGDLAQSTTDQMHQMWTRVKRTEQET
ncbi:uncharacterized protein LOC111907061 [Lactuca sativa]|uniref:uncharacterized protein LOC111907061 n=1 Tax=Lactuca sativa TaxID=4236 RepID=UPI000CD9C439|nr:uncharacterized protein LOC111907061 [Lactuca sativa]